MRAKVNWPVRIIDALCGCVVAACLIGFVWLTMVRENHTNADIGRLKRLIHQARQDRLTTEAASQEQHAVLAGRQAELAKTGRLPTETPIETYFQALSTTALRHGLRIVKHHPLSARQYPDLLEQRYAYEVTGSLPDLVEFLKSIENTDFWADVSHLKVDRGKRRKDAVSDERNAALTISLFSALTSQTPSDKGGA